jgi:hypothetical protein
MTSSWAYPGEQPSYSVALPVEHDEPRFSELHYVSPDELHGYHGDVLSLDPSVHVDETDSNFSFHLSLWDHVFGTYRDQPRGGHTGMTLGIDDPRDPRLVCALPGMLMLPFRGAVTDYAINRRAWQTPEDRA